MVKVLNKGEGKNRFVFQSFSQRLASIDVNVYRRLGDTNVIPSGADSFFHQVRERAHSFFSVAAVGWFR